MTCPDLTMTEMQYVHFALDWFYLFEFESEHVPPERSAPALAISAEFRQSKHVQLRRTFSPCSVLRQRCFSAGMFPTRLPWCIARPQRPQLQNCTFALKNRTWHPLSHRQLSKLLRFVNFGRPFKTECRSL